MERQRERDERDRIARGRRKAGGRKRRSQPRRGDWLGDDLDAPETYQRIARPSRDDGPRRIERADATATVVACHGGRIDVLLADGSTVPARPGVHAGALAVGDVVDLALPEGVARIVGVHERRTELARPAPATRIGARRSPPTSTSR